MTAPLVPVTVAVQQSLRRRRVVMDLSPPLRYSRLSSATGRAFADFYEIYHGSLPVREQKTRAQIEALVGRPDYLVVLAEQADEVLGFCMMFAAPKAFGLLEYMAVRADQRNRGLGGGLFRESMTSFSRRYGALPVLVEVDSEREASPDRDIRRRRKQFYRRLGCRCLRGLSYQLPLPGAGAPPQMDLLVYGAGQRALAKPLLRTWLELLYGRVYGVSSGDPRIDEMLAPLPDLVDLV